MTPDGIKERLRAGGIALAFDTNAISGTRRLIALSEMVRRHNEQNRAAGRAEVVMRVSTVAHFEKLLDLKQEKQDEFEPGVIVDGIRSLGLAVDAFETRHAQATAERLGERYRTSAAWRKAKRARYLESLGLPAATPAPGTGKHCGTTVDWLIGGHARAEGCVLVTDDKGPEFEGIVDRVKLDVLEEALREILREVPP